MYRVIFLVLIYFSFPDRSVAKQNNSSPPIIVNKTDELIIQTGSSLELTCESSKEITWSHPNKKVKIEHEEIGNMHRAKLTLSSATYTDTGFFYCYEIGTDMLDNKTSTSSYVYVEDPVNLKTYNRGTLHVLAVINKTVLIPCRPTSPRIEVKLFEYDEEITQNYTYDPRYGFYGRFFVPETFLICEFYGNNFKSKNNLTMDVKIRAAANTKSIARPHIQAETHVTEGDNITLTCTVKPEDNVFYTMSWNLPHPDGIKEGRIVRSNSIKIKGVGHIILNIKFVRKTDNGTYTCHVRDHNGNTNSETHILHVHDPNESFIEFSEENNLEELEYTKFSNITYIEWKVHINAHPEVKIEWFNHKNSSIGNSSKYNILSNKTETTLRINNVGNDDAGIYTLMGFNSKMTESYRLTLKVKDAPTVGIQSDEYHMENELSEVSCIAKGYPLPDIHWYFKKCLNDSCNFEQLKLHNYTTVDVPRDLIKEFKVYIDSKHTGVLKCVANNSEGSNKIEKNYYLTDVKSGFNIWSPMMEEHEGKYEINVVLDEPFQITCGVSIYKNNTDDFGWYRFVNGDPEEIIPSSSSQSRLILIKNQTSLSKRTILKIDKATKNETGNYSCSFDGMKESINVTIIVNDPVPPTFKENINNTEIKVKHMDSHKFICEADGKPKPEIIWTKNGEEFVTDKNESVKEQKNIKFLEGNSVIDFLYTLPEDEGEYTCTAKNKFGTVQKRFNLTIIDKPLNLNVFYKSLIVVIFIILIIVSVVLYIKIKRECNLKKELAKIGLSNFEKGAVDCINENLTVDDQAELLPYDKKWEFPREKLKLGKQLGSGAFGVVLKAEAHGICKGESVTTVAVKMVKRTADSTHIKALASELKIMVHLGKNLNVVNLLGACTKNIAGRELLVIFEYCHYGNLHNYLLRHRGNFIDQIDLKTGKIDVNIGADVLKNGRSMSVGCRSNSSGYRPVDYHSQFQTDSNGCQSTGLNSSNEEMCLVSNSDQQQSEWRTNYHGDYNRKNVKPICTHDLLCWAFQVSRGMEYLSSRKVLHGDLAARNILLAEDNIVKICDFGLSKSMYQNNGYKKKQNDPLPIKWMAIESIRDKIFSTQSDVWSFGIVLWEFFSLGHTPYSGMEADERLYQRLIDGYRMEKPEYATTELYYVMLNCWNDIPQKRPSFTQLSETLGQTLNESSRNYYIDRNNLYVKMNHQALKNKNQDYLLMLQSPDYNNLCSPLPSNYANGTQFSSESLDEASGTSGYLSMKSDIFSPRPIAGDVFTFETDYKNIKTKEDEKQPTPPHSSDSTQLPTCVFNPTYQKGFDVDIKINDNIVEYQNINM